MLKKYLSYRFYVVLTALLTPSAVFAEQVDLYRWADSPTKEIHLVEKLNQQMEQAYEQPKHLLNRELEFPIAPTVQNDRILTLSLYEAILLALRYNPDIQNSQIDRVVQRYQLEVAEQEFEWQYALTGNFAHSGSTAFGVTQPRTTRTQFIPTASLDLSMGGNVSIGVPVSHDSLGLHPRVNITYTQPLLRGFGEAIKRSNLRDAYDNEQLSVLLLKNNIIAQINNVIKTYRRLITSNNNFTTAQDALKDAEEDLKVSQARIKAGLDAPANLIEKQANVSRNRLSLLNAKNAQEIDRQTVLAAIGLDPDITIKVPRDVNIEIRQVPDLQTMIDYALENNIAYNQSLINYKRSKRNLMRQTDAQRADLTMVVAGEVGTEGGSGIDAGIGSLVNGRNHRQSISLNLTVPINEKSLKQQVLQAKVNLEKDRINLAAMERALRTAVKNTLTNLRSQIEEIAVAEETVKVSQQAYEIVLKKQQVGLSSPNDLTSTQNRLTSARIALITIKIAYLNTLTDLQALLATTLDEWDIELRYNS